MMPVKHVPVSPARLPACDPCRDAKVACDHGQPICSRCKEREISDNCTYRARPFKRRRERAPSRLGGMSGDENGLMYATPPTSTPMTTGASASVSQPSKSSVMTGQSPAAADSFPSDSSGPLASLHPNPGYLGSSSYITIFDQMVSNGTNSNQSTTSQPSDTVRSPSTRVSSTIIVEGARVLQQIKDFGMFPACSDLMERWFAVGRNVALCSQFSAQCVRATRNVVELLDRFPVGDVSRSLCLTSNSPLNTQGDIESFIASFCGQSPRWETLSLCFLMLPRATFFIETLQNAFNNIEERRAFRKRVIAFSDQCLEIALSLDCLNDLQLFVQYENFLAHSYVDGDQSYASWRKIGDVASSLYALGYHEDVSGGTPPTPQWLQALRKSAVARAYSADKNVAIFLGRPPRISRKFFSTKVLGQIARDLESNASKELWHRDEINETTFCYDVDTWWSAMCARLKEEALDLSRDWSRDEQIRKASVILEHAKAQWEALPPQYYLTGSLKNHSSDAKERDFVVGARLNHLHVLFITSIAQAEFVPEPCHNLVSVSARMLSMVTEAMMLRNYLSNSGTTIMWKLIYYGLPAAGIVCLYLLDRSSANKFPDIPRTKAIQDLNVLVAQIESQAFTDNEDPNYDLLSSAAKTMQAIIEKFLSGDWIRPDDSRSNMPPQVLNSIDDQLFAWNNNLNLQDFETDFWLNLADHPALGGV